MLFRMYFFFLKNVIWIYISLNKISIGIVITQEKCKSDYRLCIWKNNGYSAFIDYPLLYLLIRFDKFHVVFPYGCCHNCCQNSYFPLIISNFRLEIEKNLHFLIIKGADFWRRVRDLKITNAIFRTSDDAIPSIMCKKCKFPSPLVHTI